MLCGETTCYDDQWDCVKDNARHLRRIEKNRVYIFLAGLHKDLDEVKGRMLRRRSLPSFCEVFAEGRRDEGRRKVILGDNDQASTQGFALVIKTSSYSSSGQPRQNKRGERIWCDHC